MQVRKWNLDTDYKYLVKWWKQYDFGIVPKNCLPPTGIIISQDNKPVCAGGIYFGVGTKFAFMEWIVVDKNTGLKIAHNALKLCVEELIKMAKENDIDLLYTVTAQKALQKRYIKFHKMEIGEKNSMTFVKNLSGKTYKDLDFVKDG
jgi:hypothetical protein